MWRCTRWWGEGGVRMRKQGPQPSHTALSTKRLEVLTLMLSLLTQRRPTVSILFTSSAPLPWLQAFWPVSPSFSRSYRCVCHPPLLPHPSPSVVICYSLSRSFPPAKNGKRLSPSFLPRDSFCLLLYTFLMAGTLPDPCDPPFPGDA